MQGGNYSLSEVTLYQVSGEKATLDSCRGGVCKIDYVLNRLGKQVGTFKSWLNTGSGYKCFYRMFVTPTSFAPGSMATFAKHME